MEKGELMDKYTHYDNFQVLTNDQDRISYLKLHKGSLETNNIKVDNLIYSWTTNDWPHVRGRDNEDET